MDLHLKDKVVAVTGGSNGIGKGIARSFVEEGARVTLIARRLEKLRDAQKEFAELGYDVDIVSVDVCDSEAFAKAVQGIYEKNQCLDVFVNNAGGGESGPLIDCSVEKFREIMDLNLTSLFVGTQTAARCMKKCGGGVILNGSSFGGILPTAGKSVYAASKRAIMTLTTTFAAELAADNIRVVGYIPGFIIAGRAEDKLKTMGKEKLEAEIVSHRLGIPEDIGNVVAFLASDKASYINGTNLEITGGKWIVQNPMWSYQNH